MPSPVGIDLRSTPECQTPAVLNPMDDYPIHQTGGPLVAAGQRRPQPLRPLLLQRLRPRRRALLRRRHGPVPQPLGHRRRLQRGRPTACSATSTPRVGSPSTGATPRADRSASRSSSRCDRCGSSSTRPDPRHRVRPHVAGPHRGGRGGPLPAPQRPSGSVMDYTRLTQFGTWEGTARRRRPGDHRRRPTPFLGSRDRSWGIRTVGEAEGGAPGRRAARSSSGCGRRSTSTTAPPTST